MQNAVDELTFLNTAPPVHQLAVSMEPSFTESALVVAAIRPGQRPFSMEEVIPCLTVIHGPVRQTHLRRPLHRITARQRDKNHYQATYFHRQARRVVDDVTQPAV